VFNFNNGFSGQKLLVSWRPVMVENPIFGPKFRFLSTHVTVPLSKFSFTTIAVILKRLSECIRFRTFSFILYRYLGRPLLSLYSTLSRPSLNHLCHSRTLDFFLASSPLASGSIAPSVTCIPS